VKNSTKAEQLPKQLMLVSAFGPCRTYEQWFQVVDVAAGLSLVICLQQLQGILTAVKVLLAQHISMYKPPGWSVR
jgi:hypothetical protein